MATRPPKLVRPKAASPPSTTESSAPEIRVGYAPVGRETMAVIEDELSAAFPPREVPSAPSIEVREAPLGRETLAAIAEELLQPAVTRRAPLHTPPPTSTSRARMESVDDSAARPRVRLNQRPQRSPQNTLDYAERVEPKPEQQLVRPAPRTPTLRPLAGIAPPAGGPGAAPRQDFVIHEMVTFVVRSSDVVTLATPEARFAFVEERLMHRLPVKSVTEIERVDVTPWTEKGTVVVRVWCKV